MSALIDVRMCADPDCDGPPACPKVRASGRSMGLTLQLNPGTSDDSALLALRQEIYLSKASTSDGTEHWVPDGCTFIAHKMPTLGTPDGHVGVTAALAQPAPDLDVLLADAPMFDAAQTQDRAQRLHAAEAV